MVIRERSGINPLEVYRKYLKLPPPAISHNRLFLGYRNQECPVQPSGINMLAKRRLLSPVLGELTSQSEGYIDESLANKIAVSKKILIDFGSNEAVLGSSGLMRLASEKAVAGSSANVRTFDRKEVNSSTDDPKEKSLFVIFVERYEILMALSGLSIEVVFCDNTDSDALLILEQDDRG
ncbi:hypothetical protein ILUMI_20589 [Ignelater luminosus]|uniref:Uncharacterized protein n=1 Tax=Ignelater luminosus TaxID=2038154 RepID=A0A8K0G4F3_IGNLU|nr:hypothetical protein ILUMI_20589 [Ignelater luminosus]